MWREARAIADRESFLHWEAAFPGVWQWLAGATAATGGFDAVIGNPPWDQIEQPEIEWFALRDSKVALAATGASRKALIQQMTETGSVTALEYADVTERSKALRDLVKSTGDYPLLSGGRVNLYSLFVERSMALVKPNGFVGLLTPSGIYADKTAAAFFRSVSTAGRVSSLFDFENRKIFFKDVHASFKFCALVFWW